MLPEQQQRILGYFIEEARDHLNTIEQGLLNLQSTLNDPEMLNEVFRAAHSIKGGAAMLGLSSIQHTAHRLEDCFKVLKEHPVRVDEKLESLFLGVADTLKALLEHLSGPFGLSEEAASTLMSEAEPVFKWLNEHLELLVQQGHHGATDEGEKTILQPPTTERVGSLTEIFWRGDTAAPPESSQNPAPLPVSAAAPVTPADNWSEFQNQVLQVLREMLQLFKQQATSESRQSLQKCCRQLEKLGQQWNLPHWCDLCQAAANAIGNYENTYLTLAKIVITEIKQAQELILQGREAEIAVSQQLEALLTLPELDLFDLTLGLFDYEQPSVTAEAPATSVSTPEEDEVLALIETVQPADSVTSLSDLTEQLNQQPDAIASDNIDNTANSFISGEDIPLTVSRIDHHGPEVGLAELNTLADLFEGETQELDETWEQVEILDISAVNELEIDLTEIPTEDSDSDLEDFLSLDEAATNDQTATNFNQTEDLGLLFGDHFLEKENIAAETTINAAEDLPQSAIQSSTQESVEDLFTLDQQKLDSRESESAAVNHISATQQSILDELFLENPETNLPGESHPQEDIEDWQQTVFQPYTFENLFTDSDENVLIPTDNLEIGDLFDTPTELTTDFAQADEDLSSFWNSSEEGEAQPELDVVLPEDVAKALEESLFAAAASGEIFVELQESNSSISEDYRDAFELTFLQPDIEFNSESQDDLFGELMAPNLGKESNSPLPEMPNLTQPEALELAPEFTTPEASIEELELKVAEKQQIPLNELEMPIHGTYIQLDSFDNPSLDFLANVGFEEGNVLSTEPEIEAVSVNEIAALENIDIVSLDELLSTDINQQDVDLEQLIAETEIIDFSQLLLPEDDAPALFDNLLLIDNSQANETVESKVDDNFELFLTEFTPSPDASLAELIAETNTEDQGIKLEIYENINETIAVDVLRETADSPEILLETSDIPKAQEEQANSILAELAVSEPEDIHQISEESENQDEFADLEALLSDAPPLSNSGAIASEDFAALEALLGGANHNLPQQPSPEIHNTYIQEFPTPAINPLPAKNTNSLPKVEDEFSDLEKLLADADQNISPTSPVKPNANKSPRPANRRNARFEETMKVPVKQLDDMSNLVGELVVNRNTLEQDHERLRQSLDNLLIQVQQLSDVGARMQELYERSLLEASLLASRKTREAFVHSNDSHTDRGFSPEEMDRFTPFHTLSQEMIELIVRVRESASDIDFVTEETERVARQFRQVTTQLQEGLTRARMVPFSQAIDRLRRGVRDNAIKCGKQIELVIEGGDTLIDKMILDHLTDPLTHMLNNAIAHGIETPEERQLKGKPPVGEITIRAFHQGNQTVISVGDNGAGIDSEKVKVKAVKVGMITPEQAKTISRMEVYDLLFQPGFSIKDKADEISGRGVGMDVVRSEISEIRGTVNTDSVLGKGTTFTIRLPLTLSICKALCCVSDKARIAFPMDGVEDTLDVPAKNIQHNADGQSFISWRDTVLPFRPLKELLSFNRQLSRGNVYGGTRDDDTVSVVVVRSGNTLIALQIDLVLSEQEIVIKQFEGPAPKPIGVAGATVLGDGRIMPIADVLEIIDIFQGRISKNTAGSPWQQKVPPTITETPAEKIDPTVLIVDDSITVRELLSLTFNKAGYRVEQARDGQEAWDKLRSGLPCDIVFCDIEMPRCDGLELLSRIQKDTSLNHLPIAMLTSRGADKHRQMAIQLGASGYFTKPYLEEALLEAAVRMLKGEKLVSSI